MPPNGKYKQQTKLESETWRKRFPNVKNPKRKRWTVQRVERLIYFRCHPPSSLPFAPPIFLPIPLSYPHNTLLRSLSVSETLYLLKCVSARKVVWRARCWWLEGMASELAPGVYTRRNSLWGTAHSVVVAYTLRNSRWCMAISLARKGQARPQTPQQRCRVSQHLCLHPHSLLPPQRPPN